MRHFKGFSNGKHKTIPLPAQFYSDLLPLIDDAGELKLVLFCFRALRQLQSDDQRYFLRDDFRQADDLMQGLQVLAPEHDPDALLDDALAKALRRGVLLTAEAEIWSTPQTLYFLNTESGRQAHEQIKMGNWNLLPGQRIEILPERPNIFALYEQNIGQLTTHIADALRDAEGEYGEAWVRDAIVIAIENNARSWRYIEAILKRWQDEGRTQNNDEEPERYSEEYFKQYESGYLARLLRDD